jgi:hypothetical protein
MDDLTDDPREFAHSGNVDFDQDGLPPGMDAFLRAYPLESCIGYPPNIRQSHLTEFDGSRNCNQDNTDGPLQL